MALLRKLRSATLVEALVATVLILVVFIVASLILNNLVFNSFSRNTHSVETRMAELSYMAGYNRIKLPYIEEFKTWKIQLTKEEIGNQVWLKCTAQNNDNGKTVSKNILYESQ